MSFEITGPAIIHCGAGAFGKIAGDAARLGKRAVIVTGSRLHSSEQIAGLVNSLRGFGVEASIAPPVVGEPTVHTVDAVASFARDYRADVVIAIGGGSVMDAAKGAAVMVTNGGSTEDYQLKRREIENPPIAQIFAPTTAGTGSEATRVSVLTNPEVGVKRSISDPLMTPDVAVLDPELTLTCPLGLTTAVAMDALAHAIESAVSIKATSYTRHIALAGIEQLSRGLPKCQADLSDLDARLSCLMGSCFAGLAMQAGLGVSHSLVPAICIVGDIPHSQAVAAILPHTIRLNESRVPGVYDVVKRAMETDDIPGTLEQWCANGGVPTTLATHGFKLADWSEVLTVMARYAGHRQTNPVEVTDDYAREVFEASVREEKVKES